MVFGDGIGDGHVSLPRPPGNNTIFAPDNKSISGLVHNNGMALFYDIQVPALPRPPGNNAIFAHDNKAKAISGIVHNNFTAAKDAGSGGSVSYFNSYVNDHCHDPPG